MLEPHRRSLPALLLLTAFAVAPVAGAQASRSGDAVAPRLVEPVRFVATPGRLERTVVVPPGSARTGAPVRWSVRIDDQQAAAGRAMAAAGASESERATLSFPLPGLAQPTGMELIVETQRSDGRPLRTVFSFTLYPREPGQAIVSLFRQSTVALYDPEAGVPGVLESLGFRVRPVLLHDPLLDQEADLIVVGTGGFSRGHEALGPLLAEQARNGTPVLILDQPTLPATLTDRLRLWPAFAHGAQTDYLLATGHPAFQGRSGSRGVAYLLAAGSVMRRPYLPPTRGNFRVLAGMRVRRGPAWQEGIGIVEFPMGSGTVVAAQTALAADFPNDPGARILLINLLAYLLGDRPRLQQTFLYGAAEESLPACIADLTPDAPPAPTDLEGVELLIVPADWRAPRRRDGVSMAPLADVARFLHDGGTVLLVDPQPLVAGYLSAVVGERVEFEPLGSSYRDGRLFDAGEMLPLLQGIAPDDLDLLRRPGEREFLLRSHRKTDRFEPLLRVSGLSLYRIGRGSLIALSMPRTVDCGSPRAASLLARLLTNLGVPLEASGRQNAPRITRLGQ
jgi:hypothetical protein